MLKIFVLGYPGDMGGANTECWHTVKLWRQHGVDVHFIPTWGHDPHWKEKLDAIGCVTHFVDRENLEKTPGLEGSLTVGFCNGEYIIQAPRLRAIGCKLIWVNCMTFLFDYERTFFKEYGPADAMIYQSEFQRQELEGSLQEVGYSSESGHLIHGAFDLDDWKFQPLAHEPDSSFVIGRASRPDTDKWSSNTWKIYEKVSYIHRKALVMGVNDRTLEKMGPAPEWASYLRPMAIPVSSFYACLHCMLPVNGGARENWPRAGLEAFATGVPVVAENAWGWKEMILHGETGFLGRNDYELAYYAAQLAYDESLRQKILTKARERLVEELANPIQIMEKWKNVFETLL